MLSVSEYLFGGTLFRINHSYIYIKLYTCTNRALLYFIDKWLLDTRLSSETRLLSNIQGDRKLAFKRTRGAENVLTHNIPTPFLSTHLWVCVMLFTSLLFSSLTNHSDHSVYAGYRNVTWNQVWLYICMYIAPNQYRRSFFGNIGKSWHLKIRPPRTGNHDTMIDLSSQ